MSDSRPLVSVSLFAALLIASAAAAIYFLAPIDFSGADDPAELPDAAAAALRSQAVQPLNSAPSAGVLDQGTSTAPNASTEEPDPNPAAAVTAAEHSEYPVAAVKEEYRQNREARRAARLAAYNQMPVEDRARRLSQQWGLSEQQQQQLAQILARYSEQYAALESAAMSDAERARAQRQLQSQQMQEIAPIVRESPALKRSMQKFMEAGYARGGAVVGPRSE